MYILLLPYIKTHLEDFLYPLYYCLLVVPYTGEPLKPCALLVSPGQGFMGAGAWLRVVSLLLPWLGVCAPSLPTNPDAALRRGSFHGPARP
jgi:hypothetical protein